MNEKVELRGSEMREMGERRNACDIEWKDGDEG